MNKVIRIASRESLLAVRQAEIVMESVKEVNPGIEFELVKIKTTGDRIQDRDLDEIGGKGLFIKELEQALFNGDVDIAVHSYKDMPYEETEGLPVVALSVREAPYDALVLPAGAVAPDRSGAAAPDRSGAAAPDRRGAAAPDRSGAAAPDMSKPVGSSSLRRTIQWAMLYDGFEVKAIRGNVLTRIRKLDEGEYGALILAQAGLNRLSLQHRISRVFTIAEMIPSGSQGILAVQGREGEGYSYLDCFHSIESEIVSRAERQYLKTLGGGCSAPVAVYGELHNNELLLTGMYVDSLGNAVKGNKIGYADKAEALGEALAKELKARSGN